MSDEFDTVVRCLSAFGASSTGFGPATTEAHVEVAIAKHVPLAVFF
jgi:hypothetical protein